MPKFWEKLPPSSADTEKRPSGPAAGGAFFRSGRRRPGNGERWKTGKRLKNFLSGLCTLSREKRPGFTRQVKGQNRRERQPPEGLPPEFRPGPASIGGGPIRRPRQERREMEIKPNKKAAFPPGGGEDRPALSPPVLPRLGRSFPGINRSLRKSSTDSTAIRFRFPRKPVIMIPEAPGGSRRS